MCKCLSKISTNASSSSCSRCYFIYYICYHCCYFNRKNSIKNLRKRSLYMGEIYDWVRNTVIYLILNTIIMNLLGNSSYKKYVSIVSGMILLLIVLSPFLKLLNMEGIMDYYLNSNIYQIEARNFESELKLMEEKQREEVFADYKDNIRDQVEELVSEEGLYIYEFDL